MVRILSEPDDRGAASGSELLGLQREFQARLADETLRYMRSLNGLLGPSSPGTVLRSRDNLVIEGSAPPGDVLTLEVDIENGQEVHTFATPMLTSLSSADGTTWFPESIVTPPAALIAPGAVTGIDVRVLVPSDLPHGVYRGGLLLLGIRNGLVAVAVTIGAERPPPTKPTGTTKATAKKAAAKKARGAR